MSPEAGFVTEVPSEQGRGEVALPQPVKGKKTSQETVLAKERVRGCVGRQGSSLSLEGRKHKLTPAVTGEGGGFPSWNSVTFTYWYFPQCVSGDSVPGTGGTSPHGVYNREILNSRVLGSPLWMWRALKWLPPPPSAPCLRFHH